MGQDSSKKQNGPPKISEQQILNQAENFIVQYDVCKPTDENFNWIRLILAKMNIYGHKHMLEHLRRSSKKLDYMQKWRSIKFEHLDHVFQNLIRTKITKSQQDQIFTKVDTHLKYEQNERQQFLRIVQRGEDIIGKNKVAVLIFVGNSSTKSEEVFDKEFYKEDSKDQCLFEIIMGRLEEIGNKYGFPSTYLFYTNKNEDKVHSFLKKFKYGDKVQMCMQVTQPALNLNGNICLRDKDSPEVIEMPSGSGDFYNTSIKGMGILQKMRMDGIQFVSCCDCENMLEQVLDPCVIGLLEANKEDFDLMYKCTYPQNQKDKIFRRVVLQNGSLKADTIPDLLSIATRNSKQRTISMENIRESPVWINSVVFKVESVLKVIGSADSMSIFPQAVNYKIKNMNYWNPIDQAMRNNQNCYVFQRELSDLLINNLFKSKGIMVDRDQEYLPVITVNNEFSWRDAYKQYKRKLEKGLLVPLHQRVQPPLMMESVIRSDQYDHKKPN